MCGTSPDDDPLPGFEVLKDLCQTSHSECWSCCLSRR